MKRSGSMIHIARQLFKLTAGVMLSCIATAAFAENEISNNVGTAAR